LGYTSFRKGRERLTALLLNGGVPQEDDVGFDVAPMEHKALPVTRELVISDQLR